MLLPTSIDVLRCIERTLETVIVPSLPSTAERSAAATIGHLLRHVMLRIEHEGNMLYTEITTARPLLAQVRGFLSEASTNDATAVRAGIDSLLARPLNPVGYRDVASLSEEVGAIRQSVCDALIFFQTQELKSGTPASAANDALQRYAAWEIDQEAQIIDRAYEGFGPRR